MRSVKAAVALVMILAATAGGLEASKGFLGEGEGRFKTIDLQGLPDFSFDGALTGEERKYLGLPEAGAFTLRDIEADLVVVEFLSVYCFACIQQAPIMNDIHHLLESRDDIGDRVRFFGIAVGNGVSEIAEFKERLEVGYPILADENFMAMEAIGNPGGTPFTVLFRRGEDQGGPVLQMAHLGLWGDPDSFVEAVTELLAAGPGSPVPAPEFRLSTWRNLTPDLSPEELTAKVRATAEEIGMKVDKIEKLPHSGEENMFRLAGADGKSLWAKVGGRAKVCNICHDIYFILLFDDSGKIVNFAPIYVTKYKNVAIDEKDIAFMKGRVIGRYLTDQNRFDHEVDAISQATMSSELIFDTIRRLRGAYEQIKETQP